MPESHKFYSFRYKFHKGVLRVDSSDEDELILSPSDGISHRLILDVTRQHPEELKEYESVVRTAELYVIAYLYEHREEADHKTMTETLKYLFFGIRREIF